MHITINEEKYGQTIRAVFNTLPYHDSFHRKIKCNTKKGGKTKKLRRIINHTNKRYESIKSLPKKYYKNNLHERQTLK